MEELFKTRCTKGFLYIYEDRVSIEMNVLGVQKSNSIFYKNITGVEVNTTMIPVPFLFMKGTATVKIYSTGGQILDAQLVALPDAKKAGAMIEERLKG